MSSTQNILSEKDSRILFILGPCSIHHVESFLEYAKKVKDYTEQFSDQFFFVLRCHVEKPRTRSGWKGFLYDPHLDGSCDMEFGLKMSRKILQEIQIPAAMEFVDPLTAYFLQDFISLAVVGARTVTSPVHRQLASNLSCPVAFKNSLDGCTEHAINAMEFARKPQTFFGLDEHKKAAILQSRGNPHTILFLRGGAAGPNYTPSQVSLALNALEDRGLPSRILIDCCHGNSSKCLQKQVKVFRSVVQQMKEEKRIRGLMIESYIQAGREQANPHPEISITDPCLDWKATQKLIEEAYISIRSTQRLFVHSLSTS